MNSVSGGWVGVMSRLGDYLVVRPLSAVVQGTILGVMLPLSCASLVGLKAGRVWALALAPVWIGSMVITVPGSLAYCLAMVMAKGPRWQYPPDKRGPPADWARHDARVAADRTENGVGAAEPGAAADPRRQFGSGG